MPQTDFKSVDEYIASRPETVQGVLKKVRTIIRKALPNAEETISYQIPAYKVPGGIAIYFAGWKKHYSLYPAKASVVALLKKERVAYEVSKGTVRFPLCEPVPARLIARIAKLRANEVAANAMTTSKKR